MTLFFYPFFLKKGVTQSSAAAADLKNHQQKWFFETQLPFFLKKG
jgi:hypothetical protein